MCWVIAILGIIVVGIACFLGVELMKKFQLNHHFAMAEGNAVRVLRHWYRGTSAEGTTPCMQKVVMAGRGPFVALVGIQLTDVRIDWYGFVTSNERGQLAFLTYLGRGSAEFVFMVRAAPEVIDSVQYSFGGAGLDVTWQKEFKPHWFQRIF